MDELIFKLNNVYFSYLHKYPALCGIDMEIRKGEKIAILGANGSGKSTLLQLLDALIFPHKGRVEAFGRELNETDFNAASFCRDFRSKVGLIFQNPDIQLFCSTVKEDILFGPLQLGLDRLRIKQKMDEIVEDLGIADLLERSPHQLSVGEKRKVAIASTLIIEPDIIILDEPTAGLDPQTSRKIIDLFIQQNLDGKTVITSTHDLHIVEEISDMVYVFGQEKRVVKCGSPDSILADIPLLTENNLAHVHSHRHKDKVHIHPHLHLEHHAQDV